MPLFKLTTDRIRLGVEILFAIIVIVLIFRQKGCGGDVTTVTERGTADSTFYWKNKYDQAVASQKGLAEQFSVQDARIKHMLDSVAKVYDTKTSRIQELVVAVSRGVNNLKPVEGSTQVDVEPVPGKPDCPPVVKRMRATFADPYYLASVQLGDSSYLRLQTYDTLTALWKTVKEGGLFNRKEYLQFDIHFADTGRVVTGLTTYRKVINQKQWGIGPEARLLYLDKEIRPLAGLGVTRQTGRWNISLSAGKDFTRDVNIRTNGWYGEGKVLFKLIKL